MNPSSDLLQPEKDPWVLRLRNPAAVLRLYRALSAFVALVNGVLEVVTVYLLRVYGDIVFLDLVQLICSVFIFMIYLSSAINTPRPRVNLYLRAAVVLAFAAFFLYRDSTAIHSALVQREVFITDDNGNQIRNPFQWECVEHNEECYVSWGATFVSVFLSALIVLDVVLTSRMGSIQYSPSTTTPQQVQSSYRPSSNPLQVHQQQQQQIMELQRQIQSLQQHQQR